jgi:hypothetical protein
MDGVVSLDGDPVAGAERTGEPPREASTMPAAPSAHSTTMPLITVIRRKDVTVIPSVSSSWICPPL